MLFFSLLSLMLVRGVVVDPITGAATCTPVEAVTANRVNNVLTSLSMPGSPMSLSSASSYTQLGLPSYSYSSYSYMG